MNDIECARAIGLHLGIKGKQGGWLYQGDKVLCQGWFAAMNIWRSKGWIVSKKEPMVGCHINWRKVPAMANDIFGEQANTVVCGK